MCSGNSYVAVGPRKLRFHLLAVLHEAQRCASRAVQVVENLALVTGAGLAVWKAGILCFTAVTLIRSCLLGSASVLLDNGQGI